MVTSLNKSNLVEPLAATEGRLQQHFQQIASILRQMLATTKISVFPDWNVSPLVAGLVGESCELVHRNRGQRAQVAPFVQLQQSLWAWLSYREEWDTLPSAGATRRYSFRSLSLTVHFGQQFEAFKPQIFRIEWAGWAKWDGAAYGFQASDAGHPHWQFDALESFPDRDANERIEMLREILAGEQETVKEFQPSLPQGDARDLVKSRQLSRMHFPSAAAWWKLPPYNKHAHSPGDVRELQVWLQQSLAYVATELSRLSP